jgi:hypothetical protein
MTNHRGQTSIDFAIGMAVFLGVVLFVFTFVPGILQPFDLSGEEEPAVSNQIADSLTQDLLGSPGQPHVLNTYCTVSFFDGNESATSRCRYDSTSPAEQFDLAETQNVRIVMSETFEEDDRPSLCWTPEGDGGPELDSGDCTADDIELATGSDPPGNDTSTVTARRVVSLHGQSVTMEVLVW